MSVSQLIFRTQMFLSFLLFVAETPCMSAPLPEIHLVADVWCPYNCASKSEKPGIFIEIAMQVFAGQYSVDYTTMNWSRSIEALETGQADALVGASPNDTPTAIFPPEPITTYRDCFFTRSDSSWRFKELDDIKTLSGQIGSIKDYGYHESLKVYIQKNPELFFVSAGDESLEKLIHMLLAKRINAFTESLWVAQYTLEQMKVPNDKIVLAGSLKEHQDLYIAFSPHPAKIERSRKLARLLFEGLATLKRNGNYEKILSRYGITP